MTKTFNLKKERTTTNCVFYKSLEITGMYIKKEILPNPPPDMLKVTLEVK